MCIMGSIVYYKIMECFYIYYILYHNMTHICEIPCYNILMPQTKTTTKSTSKKTASKQSSNKKTTSRKPSAPREDKRRQWRVFEIAHFIRDNNYPNVPKIQKTFELSRSTVMRDISFLQDDYKMPIEYSEEHKGYYFTDPTFEIQSVMLSEGELLSISTILPLMEQYKNTPLEATYKSLMNKFIEMMPDKVSVSSSFLESDIKFISDPLPQIDEKVFNSVFDAIRSNSTIKFNYRSISKTTYTSRQFDPYKVICQKGNWYIIGFCYKHKDITIYSLSRIKDLELTGENFEIKKNFALDKYIDSDFGVWLNKEKPVTIELIFSPEINTLILERTWHPKQKCHQNKDGSVYLSFVSNQIQETLHWVMSFGSHVQVVNPPELKEMIKKELSEMKKLYK